MDDLTRTFDAGLQQKDNTPENQLMGLSEIIDILNTLDNGNVGASAEAKPINDLPQNPQFTSENRASNPIETENVSAKSLSIAPSLKPSSSGETKIKDLSKARIRIIEQPASKALRFRYLCEGRSAGSIPGQNSTNENRTYPAIEIEGYRGEVTIVVSCVTKDQPYRQHPHNLVGKEGCQYGVCSMRIKGNPPRAVFSNLGIQCVRRKDIKAALELRESRNVDPFRSKFAHKDHPNSIDLNVVRLCFQAFIQTGPRQYKKLTPVVSDPIYDKKAMSDLVICRLCSCSARVSGGDEIIMLCEKLTKDVKIRFFELSPDDEVVWESYADFKHTDIHKQTAIAFKTPRYRSSEVSPNAQIFIQLERPSDGATSEPLPFEYYPDPDQLKHKRIKSDGKAMTVLQRELEKTGPLPKFNDFSTNDASKWNLTALDGSTKVANSKANDPGMSSAKANWLSPSYNYGTRRSPQQMSCTPSPQPLSPPNRSNVTPTPHTQSKTSQMLVDLCSPSQPLEISVQNSNFPSDCNNLNLVTNLKQSCQQYNTIVNDFECGTSTMTQPSASNNNYDKFYSSNMNNNSENFCNLNEVNLMETNPPQYQPQLGPVFYQNEPHLPQPLNIPPTTNNTDVDHLSSLLQIESDQFINLNSDDLKLSNLSIFT